MIRDFSRFSEDDLNTELLQENWELILSRQQNVHCASLLFTTTLISWLISMPLSNPSHGVKLKQFPKPWITKGLRKSIKMKYALLTFSAKIRNFSNAKATARKKSLRINTGQIMTIFDCPILFAFNWVRYKWIGLRDVKLNTENSRFVVLCWSCHQNCKLGSFTLLFCRGWHGLVHKCVPHVQHAYFHSLDQSNP